MQQSENMVHGRIVLKGKWQHFFQSHSIYIEVQYRIFISALFCDILSTLGHLSICVHGTLQLGWVTQFYFLTKQGLICAYDRTYTRCFGFQHGLKKFQTLFDCWQLLHNYRIPGRMNCYMCYKSIQIYKHVHLCLKMSKVDIKILYVTKNILTILRNI